MKKKGGTARHSAAEIAALRRQGESRTDWRKVDATGEAELAHAVAADPDDAAGALDWTRAVKGLPAPKQAVKIRIDQRYALADVAQAHHDLEARKNTGCSVLTP